VVTSPAGLRERKKTATRQALHESAVRLAVERGVDNVTIEAIADAAEASRRTFSNYFAGKEQALLAPQVATFAAAERELATEIGTRMPADAGTVLRARLLAATFLTTLRVATQRVEMVREALTVSRERFR
jgi:AcrR family transcriptional regulator